MISDELFAMTRPHPLAWWFICPLVGIFLLYASNFLYFFVDDEGIPFVYAQQLLNHHGLVYSSVGDGRVEGYSDFLHVLMGTAVLWLTRLLHWPKISVFFVGKSLALAAAVVTLLIVFAALRRMKGVALPGAIAGLFFLALSGPFAVWSCSSLETVPFTCLVSLLTLTLLSGARGDVNTPAEAAAAVAASLVILERIDGIVYVAALLGAFVLVTTGSYRERIIRRIVLPVMVITAAYQGWRFWYFHNLVPEPLLAKLLFKLRPDPYMLTKIPARSYAVRFVDVYGWIAVMIAITGMLFAAWRDPRARPLTIALGVLTIYVAAVGDWMFGFRFFVPLLPIAALLIALTTSLLWQFRRPLGWAAMTVIVLWCGVRARAFERNYETTQNASWLRQPSLEITPFFKDYADVLAVATEHVPPRTLVAYNQAGFIPFMLDLHNIDNLGVTTKFYAELPSTDAVFTEVGRYTTLTNKRSIRATDAYLLYRDVPFLFAGYNSGLAPDQLIDGYYRRIRTIHGEGLYVRTERSTSAYRSDPTLFLENLAHLSYLRQIRVNGRAVPQTQRGSTLPFLADAYGWVELVGGSFVLEAQMAQADERVYELDINGVVSEHPATIVIELINASGATQKRSFQIPGGREEYQFFEHLDRCSANHIRVTVQGRDAQVWLNDVRVQGQSSALAKYIREQLFFSVQPDVHHAG